MRRGAIFKRFNHVAKLFIHFFPCITSDFKGLIHYFRVVIAYGAGGALESVVRDTTGIFFRKQTTQSLIEAIKRFETMRFDKDVIRARAATFDKATFQDRIQSYIADVLSHQLTQRYGT